MRYKLALVLLPFLALGCGVSPSDNGDDALDTGGGKEDRGGANLPRFDEVDAAHTTASFRRYVGNALAILRDHPTEIGRLTYAAILEQHIAIDELVDLTCSDYRRALRDLPDGGLANDDWAHLHDRNSTAAKQLTTVLDGYMWSNRIYVARGRDAHALASTLVHEVNHVLNHSEAAYYDDLPSSAFREEYRAFYAERQFDSSSLAGVDLSDHVVDFYGLDKSQIHKALLRKPLSPRLIPDGDGWLDRDLPSDPQEPADCSDL